MQNHLTIVLDLGKFTNNESLYYKNFHCDKCNKIFQDHIHATDHVCDNCKKIEQYNHHLKLAKQNVDDAIKAYHNLLHNLPVL